ncbi:MAG: 50S ribosomal protein L25/general stress protein Ctc [Rhodospirillaceae bacterium]|nr:50S ribosomal protein L25/general stress protein Ctc [Rhodospirillaceae bacterium]
MADISTIHAEVRERAGKGAARATRRSGRVPAVIYGDKKDPVTISIDPNELNKYVKRGGFFSHAYSIELGSEKYTVIPRDVQLHPVTDRPIHLDFLRVNKDSKVAVEVPIHFINQEESPGIKLGGVLNVVRHELELMVSPLAMPEFIEIDLTGKEIGDSIHISQVALPEGTRPTITDRDFTIATVAAPTVAVVEEETTEAEGAEGEGAEGAEGEAKKEEKKED